MESEEAAKGKRLATARTDPQLERRSCN